MNKFFRLEDAEQWFQMKSVHAKSLEIMLSNMHKETDVSKRQWYERVINKTILPLVENTASEIDRIVAVLKHINNSNKYKIIKYDLINNQTDVLICLEEIEFESW